MSASCCSPQPSSVDPRFRQALWVALVVNVFMFVAEVAASWSSGSVSLLADAVDFFGDAGNYGLPLAGAVDGDACSLGGCNRQAACMAAFGVVVLARITWALQSGTPAVSVVFQ